MDIEKLINDLMYYGFVEKRKIFSDAVEAIKQLKEKINEKDEYIDYLEGLVDSYQDSI